MCDSGASQAATIWWHAIRDVVYQWARYFRFLPSVGVRIISAPRAFKTSTFSWDIFSGMVMMTRYPLTAAAKAKPIPFEKPTHFITIYQESNSQLIWRTSVTRGRLNDSADTRFDSSSCLSLLDHTACDTVLDGSTSVEKFTLGHLYFIWDRKFLGWVFNHKHRTYKVRIWDLPPWQCGWFGREEFGQYSPKCCSGSLVEDHYRHVSKLIRGTLLGLQWWSYYLTWW